MKLSKILTLIVFSLALMGVVKANDQQTQQTPMNAAIGVLAIRSGASQNRRPIFSYAMVRHQPVNTTTPLA